MKQLLRLTPWFASTMLAVASFAQVPDGVTGEGAVAAATASVAHVYVSTGSAVYGYSAAANGKLTAVPGSPYIDPVGWMGENGHYLFGLETNSTVIAAYSIAADGALTAAATTDTAAFNPDTCAPYSTEQFKVDHSGKDLYNAVVGSDLFCGTPFQSFKIDASNGGLSYLDQTSTVLYGEPELDMLGNNVYSYAPECLFIDGNQYAAMQTYKRMSNGELALGNATGGFPPDPSGQGFYCPATAAADATDHLAVMLLDIPNEDDAARQGTDSGAVECCSATPVIATFTADSKGNLTTKSTYKNMPSAVTGGALSAPNMMKMDPLGKLLAVGGPGGLEVFHFNGADPITKYKLLLQNQTVTPIYWDKNNHLYVIVGGAELYVYTVTPTSMKEAPGSPYSIPNASNLIVQTL